MSYLVAEVNARGDVALNIDLRTVGSPDGLLDSTAAPLSHRAFRLLVGMLGPLDGLLDAVLSDEELVSDDSPSATNSFVTLNG